MGKTEGALGRSARCIALVGPYLSGKTTLLEAILARTGAVTRQGTIADKNTVGDANPEARDHGMSVEPNLAEVEFLGDKFTFIDCPGSIEFQSDTGTVLSACDAAVVVTEPDPKRIPALQLILKQLEDKGIPHFLFLNKIDNFVVPVREIIPMLQPASTKPLVLRQVPIWENGIATGYVDLASERAYVYREHAPSEIIEMPATVREREKEARFQMLEKLADYDDELMEQLLADLQPPRDRVFDDLARELREGLICPVLLGSAENGNGIFRLLKALRHEVPFVDTTLRRLKLENAKSAALVVRTSYSSHGGKLSVARVLAGEFGEGSTVMGDGHEERISGVFSLIGQEAKKRGPAKAGDTVAFGRLESIKSGEMLTLERGGINQLAREVRAQPVYGFAIELKDRKDEVKLTSALAKLLEEDTTLSVEHSRDTHQIVLWGQGEMHLARYAREACAQVRRRGGYGAPAGPLQGDDQEARRDSRPAQEAIRRPRPVRRRRAGDQAAAARRRLQVR